MSLVERIALDGPVLVLQNYRKLHAKVVDLLGPHSVVVAPRSLNLVCMNQANWLADAFAANGKCQVMMANAMMNNTDEDDGALDVVLQQIQVANEAIEVQLVASAAVVVLDAIEVWHIEGWLAEWLWILVLVVRLFHRSLDLQMRQPELSVEQSNAVAVPFDHVQPPELAEHIESMEWHKLACESDF